jgi:hypothetical protein
MTMTLNMTRADLGKQVSRLAIITRLCLSFRHSPHLQLVAYTLMVDICGRFVFDRAAHFQSVCGCDDVG